MRQSREEKIKREILRRYAYISNLYIAYVNRGKDPEEVGREFFLAVGDILNGTPLDRLTLYHVDPEIITDVAQHLKGGRSKKNCYAPPRMRTVPRSRALALRRQAMW